MNLLPYFLLILSWTADAVHRREVDREDVINRFEMERVSPFYNVFGGDLPPFEWTTSTGPPPEFRVEVSKDEEHVVSHSGRRFRTNSGWWYSIETFSSNNVTEKKQDGRTLFAGQQERFLETRGKDGLLQYNGFVSESNHTLNGTKWDEASNITHYSLNNDRNSNAGVGKEETSLTGKDEFTSSTRRDNRVNKDGGIAEKIKRGDNVINYTIRNRSRPSRNRDDDHVVSQKRSHSEILELPATPQVTVVTLPPPVQKGNITTRYILLSSGRVVAINVTSAVTKVLQPKSTSKGKVKAPVLPPDNFGNRVRKKQDKNSNEVSTQKVTLGTTSVTRSDSNSSRAPKSLEQNVSSTPKSTFLDYVKPVSDEAINNRHNTKPVKLDSLKDRDRTHITTVSLPYEKLSKDSSVKIKEDPELKYYFTETPPSVSSFFVTKAFSKNPRNTPGSLPTVIYYTPENKSTKISIEHTSKFSDLPVQKLSTTSPNLLQTLTPPSITTPLIFQTFRSNTSPTLRPLNSSTRNPKSFITSQTDAIKTPPSVPVANFDWNRAIPISPDIAENKAQILKPLEPNRELDQRLNPILNRRPTSRTMTLEDSTTPLPNVSSPNKQISTKSLVDEVDIDTFIRLDPISRAVATGLRAGEESLKDQTRSAYPTENSVLSVTVNVPTSEIYKAIYMSHLISSEKPSTRSTSSTRISSFTEPNTYRSNAIESTTASPRTIYPSTTHLPTSSNKLISPFVEYEPSTRYYEPTTNNLTTFYREIETLLSNKPFASTTQIPATRLFDFKQNKFDKNPSTRTLKTTTPTPIRITESGTPFYKTTQSSRVPLRTVPPKNILDTILNVLQPKTPDVSFLVVTPKGNIPLQRLDEKVDKNRGPKVRVVQYTEKPTVAGTQRWRKRTSEATIQSHASSSGVRDAVTLSETTRGSHSFVRLAATTTPLPKASPPSTPSGRRGRHHHLRNTVGFQTVAPGGALADRRALSAPTTESPPSTTTERTIMRGFKFDPTRRAQINVVSTTTTLNPSTAVSRHHRPSMQPPRAIWTRSDSRTTSTKATSTKAPVERTRSSRVEENSRSLRQRPTAASRSSPRTDDASTIDDGPESTPKPFKVYYFEPKRKKNKKVVELQRDTVSATSDSTPTRRSRTSSSTRAPSVSYSPTPNRISRAPSVSYTPNTTRPTRAPSVSYTPTNTRPTRAPSVSYTPTNTRPTRATSVSYTPNTTRPTRAPSISYTPTTTRATPPPRRGRARFIDTPPPSQRNLSRQGRTSPLETTSDLAVAISPKPSKKPWHSPFIRHMPNVGGSRRSTTAAPRTAGGRLTSSGPSTADYFPLPPASSFQEVLFQPAEIRRMN